MEKSEKPYIRALVQEFKPIGEVLEIGFTEVSASEVTKFQPKSHTVLENNPSRIEKAKAINYLTLFEGAWKSALESLNQFDSILINGYPKAISSKQRLHISELQEARGLVEETKRLTKMVAELVPNLTAIKYSNEDLDVLFSEIDSGQEEHLIQFLDELKINEQISLEQYENYLEKLSDFDQKLLIESFWKHPNRFLEFLCLSVEKILRKKGRICCYIDSNSSKYDDPAFFNKIITNPMITYEEKMIRIGSSEALAMVIQKNE